MQNYKIGTCIKMNNCVNIVIEKKKPRRRRRRRREREREREREGEREIIVSKYCQRWLGKVPSLPGMFAIGGRSSHCIHQFCTYSEGI